MPDQQLLTRIVIRGEDRSKPAIRSARQGLRSISGLSPRVRGNRLRRAAGGRGLAVYPRVCGGTLGAERGRVHASGLSPRVRGNPSSSSRRGKGRGSIPACAGEPTPRLNEMSSFEVYPRVCGGTAMYARVQATPAGLSPRVRGNHFVGVAARHTGGSIPACAGEPGSRGGSWLQSPVYPRVCGGTRIDPPHELAAHGSIPACAGEPGHRRRKPRSARVYPRVCGGTALGPVPGGAYEGLSPRVRGNPNAPDAIAQRVRSIPACAGEPRAAR